MSTSASTIEFILDQLSGTSDVRARKMFGEYALYCDEKVVALVCDDQLFLKPTSAGRKLVDDPVEAPPYPGAKSYWLVSADLMEDREWFRRLIQTTAGALPQPKPKTLRLKKR